MAPPALSTLPPDFVAQIRVGRVDRCWPWLGKVSSWGYGVGPHRVPAHLYVYRHFHPDEDPPPRGFFLAHLCGNRLCVNPRHLAKRKGW